MTKFLLTLALACLSPPLQASWLALCDGREAALPDDYRFSSADGASKILRLMEQKPPETCTATALPVPADSVRWFSLLSAGQAAQIGQSRAVVLQGNPSGKHFSGEISLDNGASAPIKPASWPLYLDLLNSLDITPFGLEERASLDRNETTFTFRCLPGQRAAGFVLHLGQDRLPPLPGLSLNLTLRGDSGFVWSASKTGDSQDPQPLATIKAASRQRTEHINLAPMLQPQNAWDGWTLLCPQSQAALSLSAMQLTAPSAAPQGRATWIWREANWRETNAALWKQLKELAITRLYITVPLSADLTQVADMPVVQAFIGQARQRGIDVWAVAGDPQAVLASERPSWLKRAKAYADYNRDSPEPARLKGVQYDIEPYLAPGYAEAPEVWKQAYVDTLGALHAASPLPLEVAVPVWWAEQTLKDKPILEAMTASVDSVTVMDYRTDPWRIQQQTESFLAWGTHNDKPVRIALEAGPVADEQRLVFRRAEVGNLWVSRVGDITLLVHLALATPGKNSDTITFSLADETQISGNTVSFHNRLDEMNKILPQLEKALGAWPTFNGLALHEVLTP